MTDAQEALLREVLEHLRWLRENLTGAKLKIDRPDDRIMLDWQQRERLVCIRRAVGLNQAQWGAKLDRSQVGVSAWEKGATSIPGEVLQAWAMLGGCSVQWILTGEPDADAEPE